MNERDILEHRLTTLRSLLEGPVPLAGSAGRALNDQLKRRWEAEERLLQRLLDDAHGPAVRDTVELWETRTGRFIASSEDAVPGWTDPKGVEWEAQLVRELLAETRDRLDRWSGEPPAASGPVGSA